MRRLVFACSAILSLLAAPAVSWAQAGTPAQALTTCGSPVNAPVQGNYYSLTTDLQSRLCGSISGSNTGGYDSGPVQVSATPANSSHAAGTSIGGLFTLSMARTNGGSGEITQFRLKSSGGSTGQYVVRIWDKNPANTTCTDNAAFVGSATDDANMVTPPFSLTPAAPSSTTGDANTYASQLSTNYGFVNADTTPGKNLYVCLVTVATNTADDNKLVYVTMDALQN